MKHTERNAVPNRNDPWVQWARAIFLLFVAAVMLASISGCQPRVGDKSPTAYDPVLYIDTETGCHYLATRSTNALTPRMDRNGKQVCR